MLPLSEATSQRVRAAFSADAQQAVISLLQLECGSDLPLSRITTPESAERIRFAVLKLSHGDLTVLRQAVDEAKIDWRDVLVSAGFANDVTAHERWWP